MNLPTGDFPYMPAQGWQCPKCKSVMAPSTPMCWYCKPQQTVTTTGTQPFIASPIPQNKECPHVGCYNKEPHAHMASPSVNDPFKYDPKPGWKS